MIPDWKGIVADYERGLSLRVIAAQRGCTHSAVQRIVRLMGSERNVTPLRGKSMTPAQIEEIRRLYVETNIPLAEIAAKFDRGAMSVTWLCRVHDWPRRRPKHAAAIKATWHASRGTAHA